MPDKENLFNKFEEILYVKPKSLLRKLVQKSFIKLLSISSGNKFLFYKKKNYNNIRKICIFFSLL